jgi:DNA-3-methyladenine glycosylase II
VTAVGSEHLLVDESTLPGAVSRLTAAHEYFAAIVARHGSPPVWRRAPGFATLILFILEQQVSLESARAAFDRLQAAIGDVTPDRFVTLGADQLRAIGFSRQKAGYGMALAEGLLQGSIALPHPAMADDEARATLLAMKGVGPWTADCYLLFVLGRADAWPRGDRALHVAMSRALDLDAVPTSDEADGIAAAWRPLRAVAARLLWHDYLSAKAMSPGVSRMASTPNPEPTLSSRP